jgi:hypothetical protein
MATCAIALHDKRTLARDVGKHLSSRYGKRAHYSAALVKATMRRLKYPDVWDCWALSLFTAREDFDAYHAARGEICDYAVMNGGMLQAVDSGSVLEFVSGDWSFGDLLSDGHSPLGDFGDHLP